MQKNKNKIRFAVILIFALSLILPVLPGALAQSNADINVTLDVDLGEIAEIDSDGCWAPISLTDELPWWGWSGLKAIYAVTLRQPGDRIDEVAFGDPAEGEDSHWGSVHGTAVYDTEGGNPNSNIFDLSNTNAFGYGDCKFTISVNAFPEYNIELYATDFEHTNPAFQIPDMVDYNQADFDFTLDAEDPPYNYDPDQGEHGFYILATDISSVKNDTGAAAGTTYTGPGPKAYDDDSSCNTDRPCYHFFPNTATSPQVAHVLFDETSGDFNDGTLIIRTGLGLGGLASGDYSMTYSVNLNTAP